MKILFKFSLFIALLLATSCATQTFSVDKNVKREVPSANPHFSKWSHFFLAGVGQNDFQNASQLCKENDGVAFVEARQSFGQVILTAITFNIYSPRTMNIYCNKQ